MRVIPFILMLSFVTNPTYCNDVTDIIMQSNKGSDQASNEATILLEQIRESSKDFAHNTHKPNSFYDTQKLKPNKSSGQKQPIKLAIEGKGACGSKNPLSSQKCPSALMRGARTEGRLSHQKDSSHQVSQLPQLLVFVSTSMPGESIKALWQQAQKIGGRVILRGLIGGTFKQTQKYIQELGIVADIDPPKFEEFEIKSVPTFVLMGQGTVDQASGHISLLEFLEHVKGKGDLKAVARAKLKQFYEGLA